MEPRCPESGSLGSRWGRAGQGPGSGGTCGGIFSFLAACRLLTPAVGGWAQHAGASAPRWLCPGSRVSCRPDPSWCWLRGGRSGEDRQSWGCMHRAPGPRRLWPRRSLSTWPVFPSVGPAPRLAQSRHSQNQSRGPTRQQAVSLAWFSETPTFISSSFPRVLVPRAAWRHHI